MFELGNLSFIICLSTNILLMGALYYYFNLKIKHVEGALIQQNKVLADFITHVKTNFNGNTITDVSNTPSMGGAAPEAVLAAKEFMESENNKINVSDAESETGSEQDSDNDSEINDSDSEESESESSDEEQEQPVTTLLKDEQEDNLDKQKLQY